MNLPPGMTPYPPERNVWQYPPPPVSPRWFKAAILAIVGSVVAAVGLGVLGGIIASKDFPGVIQNHELVTVIERECSVMRSTVNSMPVEGDTTEQLAILADQNRAVQQMLTAIRSVDAKVRAADKPTDQWLGDWDRLLRARETFAKQRSPKSQPSLLIPRDANGNRISDRMNDVWLTDRVCTVPEVLLNPYPQNVDDV